MLLIPYPDLQHKLVIFMYFLNMLTSFVESGSEQGKLVDCTEPLNWWIAQNLPELLEYPGFIIIQNINILLKIHATTSKEPVQNTLMFYTISQMQII